MAGNDGILWYGLHDPVRQLVKIGHSAWPESRCREMFTALCYRCELLWELPGGRTLERAAHAKWAHLNVAGEWFRPDDEMREWIAEQERQSREWKSSVNALRPILETQSMKPSERKRHLKMRQVTMKDIARECACDIATVSRVNAELSENTEIQDVIARYLGVVPEFAFPRARRWKGVAA